MTTTKTFSRARSAEAALQKIIDMHELTAVTEVTALEVEDGRFTAHAQFAPGADIRFAEADLAGFSWARPAAPIVFEEVHSNVEYPDPEPEPEPEAPTKPVDKKPRTVGATKRVHQIADAMRGASRKEVVAACVAEGIAMGTARTQYQIWFKNNRG